jgi:hypothetical protein
MKAVIMLFAYSLLLSFTVYEYQIKPSTAEAIQVQGLYIFTDSKPVSDYEYLGTVNVSMSMSGQYNDVKNSLIKKTKKDFPNAEAIIITLVTGSSDKADVIRFK